MTRSNRVSPVLHGWDAADVGRDAFNGSSTCIQVALDAMLGRGARPPKNHYPTVVCSINGWASIAGSDEASR